jgi:putative hydrolase of the HAD superfamily
MGNFGLIRAVFFDWFNTLALYEPPREELHSQVLHKFGIDIAPSRLFPGLLAADKYFFAEVVRSPVTKRSPEEQGKAYIRYAEIMLDEAGCKVDQELIPQIVKEWPQVFNRTQFVLFDDVLPTFKTLKERHLKLGLITNASKDAISIHRKLGLEPYLDFTVTSEEAKTDKPDPAIFLLALEKAGVIPSAAIHVGDQYEVDIVGARGAGITPVLIDRFDLYPEIKDCLRIRALPELLEHL